MKKLSGQHNRLSEGQSRPHIPSVSCPDSLVRRIWYRMIYRCYFPEHSERYWDYGGRGIRVCRRWHNIDNFVADMGPRPSPQHSIDRIDNNDDYAPDNCKWSTRKEQQRNTRANRLLSHAGLTMTAVEWEEKLGLKHDSLRKKINQGWALSQIVSGEAFMAKSPKGIIDFCGLRLGEAEWARRLHITRQSVHSRRIRGWFRKQQKKNCVDSASRPW